jgi:zinc protease
MIRARRSALLAAFLVVLSAQAVAAQGLQRPQRYVLDNGVVLIVLPHRAADVVAVQLWLKVGGRDEAADELGLSHYLEHMLFKGTPTRPPGSIDRMVESVGGQSNAFTSYDIVHYDVVLPADRVAAGIELLADIGVNASLDPVELNRERKVVLEEVRLVEDDPDQFLLRRLTETAFASTPYGRPILGTPKFIKALTRGRLERYYAKRYVSGNMVLVVVGAVDPGEVRGIAGRTFGRLTGAASPRPPMPAQPDLTGGRTVDVRRPETQAYLGLAWKAPSVADKDVFAADLLTYILGYSPSSRLPVIVRDTEGLVSSIKAGYITRERGGVITVTARLDAKNLAATEESILAVIRKVQEEGVTEEERQRAIVTAEASYAFDIETAEGLAQVYGQAETTYSLEEELQYLGRLRETTAAEIQAAATKYLRSRDYARVRFLPQRRRR